MCYDAYVYAAPKWRMSAAYELTRTKPYPVVIPSTPLWQNSSYDSQSADHFSCDLVTDVHT